ncbi:MAG: S8 family serine peptidase [Deltaproteobacteria bacterium]|nr:S8 family serine peptidase [Deltaproteobacteria bacterium]
MIRPLRIVCTMVLWCLYHGAIAAAPSSQLSYVPNEVIVELAQDHANPLTVIAHAISPTFSVSGLHHLYPHLGESSEAIAMHRAAVAKKFAQRQARQPRQAPVQNLHRFFVVRLSGQSVDVERAVRMLADSPDIRSVSPNYYLRLLAIPNDPYFSTMSSWKQPYADLWGLYNVDAEEAWEVSTGDSSLVVGVIDTGVDWEHEDLQGNMYQNLAELNGKPAVDDDGNGYVDDVYGYDFADDDPLPQDLVGHGTHVAGTIGAVGDNTLGVVGMMWNAKIMAVKVLGGSKQPPPSSGDPTGFYASVDQLAGGVVYAADNGADVVNMSLGTIYPAPAMQSAIAYANSLGVIHVVAAGNDAINGAGFFPAGYAEVITVAASTVEDTLSSFSNYGEKIDVAAPGGGDASTLKPNSYNILSLRAGGTNMLGDANFLLGTQYALAAGTSMASPHVAGLVGLILSAYQAMEPPLTVDEVRQIVRMSAEDFGKPAWDNRWGYGRINAAKALATAAFCEAQILSPQRHTVAQVQPVTVTGMVGGHHAVSYALAVTKGGQGESWSTWEELDAMPKPDSGDDLGSVALQGGVAGKYRIRLRVYDAQEKVCGEDQVPFQYSALTPSHTISLANAQGMRFGEALAVGDINNDGLDDLVIGAPTCLANSQTFDGAWCISQTLAHVYVVYGQETLVSSIALVPEGADQIAWVAKSPSESEQLGFSVAVLDFDADGFDDVALGYSSATTTNGSLSGRVCLFLGKYHTQWSSAMPWTSADACWIGEHAHDYFGFYVINGGDLNGDGADDLVASSGGFSANQVDIGRVYILYGKSANALGSLTLPIHEVAGSMVTGYPLYPTTLLPGTFAAEGMRIAGPGDVTGDGIDDLLLAPQFAPAPFLVPGHLNGIPSHMLDEDEYGQKLTPVGKLISFWSQWPSRAGDVNGDGIQDFLTGFLSVMSQTPAGFQLIYGHPLETSGPNAKKFAVNQVEHPYFLDRMFADFGYQPIVDTFLSSLEKIGRRVLRTVGDVNGDGMDEFVSGEIGYQEKSVNATGLLYGFWGAETQASGLAMGLADFVIRPPMSEPPAQHFGWEIVRATMTKGGSLVAIAAPGSSLPRVYLYNIQTLVPAPILDSDLDGITVEQGDCSDTNPDVHPGAEEICDGFDNGCDGEIDEDFPQLGAVCTGLDPEACQSYTYRCNGPESVSCQPTPFPVGWVLPNQDNVCQQFVCKSGKWGLKKVPQSVSFGTPCDDGLFCNGAEKCNGIGACISSNDIVDDAVACTVDSCDEEADQVTHAPNNALCNDKNQCTVDTCSAESGCAHTPIGAGKVNACGGCAALSGKPGTPCQLSPAAGTCVTGTYACSGTESVVCQEKFQPKGMPCLDGLFCNGAESCDGKGSCQSGLPPVVNDGLVCTNDFCDETVDAVKHEPIETGTVNACGTCGKTPLEVCDGLDNDCDGGIDEYLGTQMCGVGACQVIVANCMAGMPLTCVPKTPSAWYRDLDGDGYGDPDVVQFDCAQPAGYVADHADCNDAQSTVHPGAAETGNNGIDEDCTDGDLIVAVAKEESETGELGDVVSPSTDPDDADSTPAASPNPVPTGSGDMPDLSEAPPVLPNTPSVPASAPGNAAPLVATEEVVSNAADTEQTSTPGGGCTLRLLEGLTSPPPPAKPVEPPPLARGARWGTSSSTRFAGARTRSSPHPPPAAKPGQGPAVLGREAKSKTVRSVMEPPPQRRGAAGLWGPTFRTPIFPLTDFVKRR